MALGYVPEALAAELDAVDGGGDGLAVEILGVRRHARLVDRPLFDPDATRMRG